MENYLSKNLAALNKHQPDLAQQVSQIESIPGLKAIPSSSGEWDLECKFSEEQSFRYYQGHQPLAYSEDLVSRLDFKNPRIIIFFGMGLGYHLLSYARKPHPLNHGLVILEPFPQIFKLALELNDFSAILEHPNVFIHLGQDDLKLDFFFRDLFSSGPWLRFANGVEYFPLPVASQLSQKYFTQVQKALPKAIGHQYNRIFADPFDTFIGVENSLENLDQSLKNPNIDQFKNLFKGKPGLVFASGPSLIKSLDIIKDLTGQFVSAACPSALSLLLKEGIKPDLWVNIERNFEQARLFRMMPDEPGHFMVGPPHIKRECFELHENRSISIMSQTGIDHWLPYPWERYDLGHSSANAAFLILHLLGCDPIFMLGQDLVYQDGKSHADGVWEVSISLGKEVKRTEKEEIHLPGYDGKLRVSNRHWNAYHKTFEDYLVPLHKGTVYHVCPIDMGAKIRGVNRIDPEDLSSLLDRELCKTLDHLRLRWDALRDNQTYQEEQRRLIAEKLDCGEKFLKLLLEKSQVQALKTKRLQFSDELCLFDWDQAKALYENYMKDLATLPQFFERDSNHPENKNFYDTFLYPIIQGLMIRFEIEFFSSGADLKGDKGEVKRKLELMFQKFKDEAYWAVLCQDLIRQARHALDAL